MEDFIDELPQDPHDDLVMYMKQKYYKAQSVAEVRKAMMSSPESFDIALKDIHQSNYGDMEFNSFKSTYLSKKGDPFSVKKKDTPVGNASQNVVQTPTQPSVQTPQNNLIFQDDRDPRSDPRVIQLMDNISSSVKGEPSKSTKKVADNYTKLEKERLKSLSTQKTSNEFINSFGGSPLAANSRENNALVRNMTSEYTPTEDEHAVIQQNFSNLTPQYQTDIQNYLGNLKTDNPSKHTELISRIGENGMDEKTKTKVLTEATNARLAAKARDYDILKGRKQENQPISRTQAEAVTTELNSAINDTKNVIMQFPEEYKRLKKVRAKNEMVTIKEGDNIFTQGVKQIVATGNQVQNSLIDTAVGFLKTSKAIADEIYADAGGGKTVDAYGMSDRIVDGIASFGEGLMEGEIKKYENADDLTGKDTGFNKETFLPKVARTITDMVAMMYGSGGTKAGLTAAGAITQYASFHDDAVDKGLGETTARRYGLGMSFLQGALENISPNFGVLEFQKMGLKEAKAFFAQNPTGSTGEFIKHILRTAGKENAQEIMQGLSEKGANFLANKAIGKDLFKTGMSSEELAETVLLTTATTILFGGMGRKNFNKQHAEALQLLQIANPEDVTNVLNEAVASEQVTFEKAQEVQRLVDEKVDIAPLIVSEDKAVKEINEENLITKPTVKNELQDATTPTAENATVESKPNTATSVERGISEPQSNTEQSEVVSESVEQTNGKENIEQSENIREVIEPTSREIKLNPREQRAAEGVLNSTKDAALYEVLSKEEKANVSEYVKVSMQENRANNVGQEQSDAPVVAKKEKRKSTVTTKGTFGNTKAIQQFEPTNTEEQIMQDLALGSKLRESDFAHLQGVDKEGWIGSQVADENATNENSLDFNYSDKDVNEAKNAFENITLRYKNKAELIKDIKRIQEERTQQDSGISEKDIERQQAIEQYAQEKASRNEDVKEIDQESYQAHSQHLNNIEELEAQAASDADIAQKHSSLYDRIISDPQYQGENGFDYAKLRDNIENGFEPDILNLGIFEDANKITPKDETEQGFAERVAKTIESTQKPVRDTESGINGEVTESGEGNEPNIKNKRGGLVTELNQSGKINTYKLNSQTNNWEFKGSGDKKSLTDALSDYNAKDIEEGSVFNVNGNSYVWSKAEELPFFSADGLSFPIINPIHNISVSKIPIKDSLVEQNIIDNKNFDKALKNVEAINDRWFLINKRSDSIYIYSPSDNLLLEITGSNTAASKMIAKSVAISIANLNDRKKIKINREAERSNTTEPKAQRLNPQQQKVQKEIADTDKRIQAAEKKDDADQVKILEKKKSELVRKEQTLNAIANNGKAAVRRANTTPNGLAQILSKLKKAFPNISVVTDPNTINNIQAQLGIPFNAYYMDGTVYIDLTYAHPMDVLHEYAHLWVDLAKKMTPQYWNRAKTFIEKTPYFQTISSDLNYKNKPETWHEEAFILAFEEAQNKTNSSSIIKAKKAIQNIYDAIKNAMGLNPSLNITDMTLGDFVSAAIKDINRQTPLTSASSIDVSNFLKNKTTLLTVDNSILSERNPNSLIAKFARNYKEYVKLYNGLGRQFYTQVLSGGKNKVNAILKDIESTHKRFLSEIDKIKPSLTESDFNSLLGLCGDVFAGTRVITDLPTNLQIVMADFISKRNQFTKYILRDLENSGKVVLNHDLGLLLTNNWQEENRFNDNVKDIEDKYDIVFKDAMTLIQAGDTEAIRKKLIEQEEIKNQIQTSILIRKINEAAEVLKSFTAKQGNTSVNEQNILNEIRDIQNKIDKIIANGSISNNTLLQNYYKQQLRALAKALESQLKANEYATAKKDLNKPVRDKLMKEQKSEVDLIEKKLDLKTKQAAEIKKGKETAINNVYNEKRKSEDRQLDLKTKNAKRAFENAQSFAEKQMLISSNNNDKIIAEFKKEEAKYEKSVESFKENHEKAVAKLEQTKSDLLSKNTESYNKKTQQLEEAAKDNIDKINEDYKDKTLNYPDNRITPDTNGLDVLTE
ncbi:MAG: hypothetical protein ACRCSC_02700, partial [Lactococcus garvieae]